MDIKKYLKAMPVVAALLFTASCSNEDDEINEAPQPAQRVRIIHYEATVNNGNQTRATLIGDNKYVFETGDKLYVWGDNISGELTLTRGAGDNSDAVFSGDLTYTPGNSDPDTPKDNLGLKAVIVSPNDKIFGTLEEFKARNFEPSYTLSASTPYASSRAEAVQRFSYFKASSNYSEKSFEFCASQNSTFLSFDITLEDGTAAGTTIPVIISNDGTEISKGSVTTVKEGEAIKAKFVAGILGYIRANNAIVTLDNRDAISFGGTEWLDVNKIYNVTRTYTRYKITASGTVPAIGYQEQVVDNKAKGYSTKLQEMLTALGFSALGALVSNCSIKEGTNVSVEYIPESNPKDYRFTVNSDGTTIFTISTGLWDVDFTIKVEKMTPPTE